MIVTTVAVLWVRALPSGGLPSLSYDSFRYLAGAHSILETGTYRDISGAPQRIWPPGTSLLYAAAARLTDTPPDQLVRAVNLGALLFTAIFLWLILELSIERRWIALLAFAVFMLNTAFLSMHNKLWSDPLALATNTAVLACAILAARSIKKNWYGWFLAACVLLAMAISFRFAMIAGVPVLACLAFWLSATTGSHRHAIMLPLLSPIPTIILFRLLGISGLSDRISGFSTPNIQQMWDAFRNIGDQFFPIRSLSAEFASTITLFLLIALPFGIVLCASNARKCTAVILLTSYSVAYCLFLLLAQVVPQPPVVIDLRILLQIYPFLLISFAVAIDALLSTRAIGNRGLALAMSVLLAIAAARSIRAAAQAYHREAEGATCISRDEVASALRTLQFKVTPPQIVSNVQGLAWYVLRIPANSLTWKTLNDAPRGAIVVYVRAQQLCPYVIEFTDIDETALTRAPQVKVLSANDVMLIARKE